jgi:hypothetical protein
LGILLAFVSCELRDTSSADGADEADVYTIVITCLFFVEFVLTIL